MRVRVAQFALADDHVVGRAARVLAVAQDVDEDLCATHAEDTRECSGERLGSGLVGAGAGPGRGGTLFGVGEHAAHVAQPVHQAADLLVGALLRRLLDARHRAVRHVHVVRHGGPLAIRDLNAST